MQQKKSKYRFEWPMTEGSKKGVYAWEGNEQFVFIESDGEQIFPQSLTYWCVLTDFDPDGAPHWGDGPALTEQEIKDISSGALAYLDRVRDEMRLESVEIRNRTKHTPFGRELMESVVRDLQSGYDICDYHRDYCGHGLFYRDGKFILSKVDSGYPFHTLAEWADKESFIDFFARQSDYTCSGADPDSPVFMAESTWDIDNQRLTRQRLESLRLRNDV